MRLTALMDCSASRDFAITPPICSPMKAHQRHFVRRVLVRLLVVYVDDADQFATADEGHRKEGREGIFRQRLETA